MERCEVTYEIIQGTCEGTGKQDDTGGENIADAI